MTSMKERIPWPVKFAAKIVFGLARLDYRVLKRAHLVEHGRMEQAGFSETVFERQVRSPLREQGSPLSGCLLELGPGDSIATGLLGRAAGYDQVILVDVGEYADLRPEAINRLQAALGGESLWIHTGMDPQDVRKQLCRCGIEYRTDGVVSLEQIAAGRVTHSFSNSVLQHVYRDSLPDLLAQLGRSHAPASYTSHSINFSDHFSGGFVNHRLPAWFMESDIIKRANLYTNRVSADQFADHFNAAGFIFVKAVVELAVADSQGRVAYDSVERFKCAIAGKRVLRTSFLFRKR